MTKKITATVFLMALPEFRHLPHANIAMESTWGAKNKSIQYIEQKNDSRSKKLHPILLLGIGGFIASFLQKNSKPKFRIKKSQPWKVGLKGH